MEIEQRLARQLKRLHKSIQQLVAKAPEFGELRQMLRDEHVELAIYVVPLVAGQPMREPQSSALTETDKHFLKQAGIRF